MKRMISKFDFESIDKIKIICRSNSNLTENKIDESLVCKKFFFNKRIKSKIE